MQNGWLAAVSARIRLGLEVDSKGVAICNTIVSIDDSYVILDRSFPLTTQIGCLHWQAIIAVKIGFGQQISTIMIAHSH